MPAKISLYECANARCLGDKIYCARGHHLGAREDGKVSMNRLKRGEPLVYAACRDCAGFDRNGDPIPKNERGW